MRSIVVSATDSIVSDTFRAAGELPLRYNRDGITNGGLICGVDLCQPSGLVCPSCLPGGSGAREGQHHREVDKV